MEYIIWKDMFWFYEHCSTLNSWPSGTDCGRSPELSLRRWNHSHIVKKENLTLLCKYNAIVVCSSLNDVSLSLAASFGRHLPMWRSIPWPLFDIVSVWRLCGTSLPMYKKNALKRNYFLTPKRLQCMHQMLCIKCDATNRYITLIIIIDINVIKTVIKKQINYYNR